MDLGVLFDDESWRGLFAIGGHLLLLVVATLIALRFASLTIRAALTRLFEREVTEGSAQDVSAVELQRRRETLDGLLNRALRVIILIIAFLMALQIMQLDIGPAIAGLGIVGLALSLGAQHLVRDYVAGAFVLIENQYSKGDLVTIAGATGTVEDVSLRRTTLRDLDGTVHYVPHGLIQTSSNRTRSWAGIDLDIPLPYDESLGRARAAIDRAGTRLAEMAEWRTHVLEVPRVVRIERLGDPGLVLKVYGRVTAGARLTAAGALRALIVDEFDRANLTLGWRPLRAPAGDPPPAESP